jgi:hypothetical protein
MLRERNDTDYEFDRRSGQRRLRSSQCPGLNLEATFYRFRDSIWTITRVAMPLLYFFVLYHFFNTPRCHF